MRFSLIIIKSSPYLGRQSHEILEAVMSLALFEIEHKVVFFDDGLLWLGINQHPQKHKSLEKNINALPLYDSEELYYCMTDENTLLKQSIQHNLVVEPVDESQLSQWLRDAHQVEVF